jgi:OOP family OmpA-OmpF porin
MNKLIYFIFILFLSSYSRAQIFKRIEDNLSKKVEQKIDQATDRAINGKSQNTNNSNKVNSSQNKKSGLEEEEGGSSHTGSCSSSGSILFTDNFESTESGDFPTNWNSNSGGEVKKLKGMGKFLKITPRSVINPKVKKLPESFTVTFDLIMPSDAPQRMASMGFGPKPRVVDYLLAPNNRDGIEFSFHTSNSGHGEGLKYGRQGVNTTAGFESVPCIMPTDEIIKICFVVSGKRIQMYVDGEKKIDMSQGFDPSFRGAFYFCASTSGSSESKVNNFYVSNFSILDNTIR